MLLGGALPVLCCLPACTPAAINVAGLPEDTLFNGLAAYWTFDETFGLTVADDSGNGRDGTISGGSWNRLPMPYGKFAGALYLAGSDTVSVPAFPQATPAFTVSAWVRVTSADLAATQPPLGALLSNETVSGGWAVYLELPSPPSTANPSYVLVYYLGPGQSYARAACACFVADAWTHVAAVVDADAGSATLYVSGAAPVEVPVPAGISPGQSTLLMGRWPAPVLGPLRNLTGALDDVAIWTRALTAEEIGELDVGPVRLLKPPS
jgi:hypothetical protein